MKKVNREAVASFMLLALMFLAGYWLCSTVHANADADMARENDALRQEVASLEEANDQLQGTLESRNWMIQELQDKISELSE